MIGNVGSSSQHNDGPPHRAARPFFHVVLHEPEIPNNTGNIGRTCVATGCALHLIHPLGFDTGEKACRRAGLDYWPRLDVRHHDSLERFLAATPARVWLFSTKARRCLFEADLRPGDALLFGPETRGLPQEILDPLPPEHRLFIPMRPGNRSLNLSNAVAIVLYEAWRQLGFAGAQRS